MGKYLVIGLLVILAFSVLWAFQYVQFSDKKFHIVFCDVGQGDAIYLRTPEGSDILLDGGPNDSVLSCLSNHMPFWDRDIELMILTHPHSDHLKGFLSVIPRYTVKQFYTEDLKNANAADYKKLMKLVQENNISVHFTSTGDTFTTPDAVTLRIVTPTKAFLDLTSPQGGIGESKEFGSLSTLVSYGEFDVLLTGDSQSPQLNEAVDTQHLGSLEVLQSPHHGSRTGLDDHLLQKIHPKYAAISTGHHNRYGHPHAQTLQLLKAHEIEILRTDQLGDVEFVSDGKEWKLK